MNAAPPHRQGLFRVVRARYAVLAALLFAATAVASEAPDALIRRYPFDPACPWGRVNNGKGMIVRCLSEDEADKLIDHTPLAQSTPRAPAGSATPGAPGEELASPPSPQSATAPAAAKAPSGKPPEAPTSGAGSSGTSAGSPETIEVTVGPIRADRGELSVSKLQQPKARYARCVAEHGGLRDRSGEVHVRFLVRSEGIAEGVSVQKRVNVSAEGARCVAEIVDRRRVGAPDAPLVGATVVVKFDKLAAP